MDNKELFEMLNQRFDKIDKRFEKMDERMDKMEQRLDVVLPNLVAQQAVQRTAEELGGNEFVEPGGYDAHLDAFGDQLSLEGFHN